MIKYTCDICGKEIQTSVETRYELKLETVPISPPLELEEDDLSQDHLTELSELLNSDNSVPVVQDQGIQRKYDLCVCCHEKFLAQPLQMVTMKVNFSTN